MDRGEQVLIFFESNSLLFILYFFTMPHISVVELFGLKGLAGLGERNQGVLALGSGRGDNGLGADLVERPWQMSIWLHFLLHCFSPKAFRQLLPSSRSWQMTEISLTSLVWSLGPFTNPGVPPRAQYPGFSFDHLGPTLYNDKNNKQIAFPWPVLSAQVFWEYVGTNGRGREGGSETWPRIRDLLAISIFFH